MAEVFRVGNGDGRDVQYDYSEAERLWNDSEPTAPGPGGVLTRAAFLESLDAPVDATTPSGMAVPRRRWAKASPLLALGLMGAAAIFFYQRGAGSAAPVAASPRPASAEHGRPKPVAGCTTDKEAEAAAPGAAAHAGNSAVGTPPALALAGPGTEHAPTVEPGPRYGEGRSRRHTADRRGRRADAATAPRGASEGQSLEVPASPPGRRRLRPIDVSDPFAP